ncbi:MAG: TIGR03000 domain-containing protein, partial [Pirellulales bacterium]|nr:TIGR03000 domain-containing protein [Pirellulales bacterium]
EEAAEAAPTDGAYRSGKPAVDADATLLTVAVPAQDAVVKVNGQTTTSHGTLRQFMSRGLQEGFVYTYVVEVTYNVGDQEKTATKSIKLRPGDVRQLVFDDQEAADDDQADEVVTTVKLNVPADAQVTLAGNQTHGSGPVRTFRTKQLKQGEQWTDYTIRVTQMVNGQPVSKERTVDVEAGRVTELTFEFDPTGLAQR